MSILWQCADVVISHCQRMLLFYKVMATVDWKKLEGRIFRLDVNTSTEDALKAKNPAIIHFTTEGNIVFNGVQFAGVKKAYLNLHSEYEFLKAEPIVTTLDEARVAINHLRGICKTLVDKLEEAGTLKH